ncbi:MAG TPA: GNAT family N-acetyltransferase [Pyrinomonadaceae bacterium]|nr:GNAT family N-acetyltransferase [Pyrinomonadaceae bacterium]
MTEIETSRLRLRMFTEEDLDALSLITGDPEVMKYLGTSEPRSREKTRNTIDAILRHWEQHGFGIFALEHKADRRLIGWCGLQRLEKTPEVEVAYLLAKEYWNQGLATEAARAAIRYGFDELKLGRVVAIARPENVGSYRVMEKAGMKYERDANYYNVDVVYYALDLKP